MWRVLSIILGVWAAAGLISRAPLWREVAIPAAGMAMFGGARTITILIEWASVQPPTVIGYFIAATPPVLLGMGVYLLMPGRARKGMG